MKNHLISILKKCAVFPLQTPAPVMELVDVPDSKSGAARRGGSSPPRGTISIAYYLRYEMIQPLNLVSLRLVIHCLLNYFLGERGREQLNEGVDEGA